MTQAAASRDGDPASIAQHGEFPYLKRKIIEISGLQYFGDKDSVLAERIEQRRRILRCSVAQYFRRALDRDGEELAALIDEITVGETYFFRYPEQFDALSRVILPDCIARRQRDRTLRIWSAGCASGAEPYSVAMVLRHQFAGAVAGWHVPILGTDINRKTLDQARSGLFTNWDLRTTSEELKHRCFVETGKFWSVRPEYRNDVRFEHQNLNVEMSAFAAANAGAFDLILCRNVMIYFGPEAMRTLLHRLSECLVQGGWLLVGHAEPYFEIANFLSPTPVAGAMAYRKLDRDRAGVVIIDPAPAAFIDDTFDAHEVAATARPAADHCDPRGREYAPPTMPAQDAAPSPTAAQPQVEPAESPAAVLAAIRRLADAGDWRAAVGACEAALRRYPLEAGLYYVHALISEHLGAPVATEQALSRAIYLDRNFALAHYHLGRCQAVRGDVRTAARSFANTLTVLAGRDDKEELAAGDGLMVAELNELTRFQLDLLGRR